MIDRFHGVLNRQRRVRNDFLGEGFRAGKQVARGGDFVYQADPVRIVGGNHLAGQHQLHRNTFAHQARQALRSTVAGNDAELHFRLSELGIRTGEAHGAGHGNLAAAAERKAVDTGDHRLSQVLDEVEHRLSPVGVLLAGNGIVFGEFADVGARDECLLARAGEDADANSRIALDVGKRSA